MWVVRKMKIGKYERSETGRRKEKYGGINGKAKDVERDNGSERWRKKGRMTDEERTEEKYEMRKKRIEKEREREKAEREMKGKRRKKGQEKG